MKARQTQSNLHRRMPYRRHDNNNDDRGRDWFRPHVVTPETYNREDDWEQYISHFEDCAELGNWLEKEKVPTLAANLRAKRVCFTQACHLLISGPIGNPLPD